MRTILVGISGCSSSGKTTLARILRDIWPNSILLHEDDFYWPDDQIPVKGGVQDWDCLEAIDISKLHSTLQWIRSRQSLPPDFSSKEDQNSVGKTDVDEAVVTKWKGKVRQEFDAANVRLALIDGFLLYSEAMKDIRRLFDIKLFLRTDYSTAKARREARTGYVTLEGFWEDPPRYVEQFVWPNYVKDHSFLFENRDVEGKPDPQVCDELGIHAAPEWVQNSMTSCVDWACSVIWNSSH